MCCYLHETQQLYFVSQANHGGVRGKLPKEIDEEEVVENMEDLENSTDELMATPNDDNEVNKTYFFYGEIIFFVLILFFCYILLQNSPGSQSIWSSKLTLSLPPAWAQGVGFREFEKEGMLKLLIHPPIILCSHI